LIATNESKIDLHEFDGKRVLVTGGSKGIGQAVVARLRDGGAKVLATARTRPSDLAATDLFVAARSLGLVRAVARTFAPPVASRRSTMASGTAPST